MKRTQTTNPPPKPPEGSLDLLRFAIDGGDSTREISRRLGLNSNALNLARHRGRLSPTSAAALANYLGLDAVYWTAFAALEAEPDTPLKASLLAKIRATAKAFHNAWFRKWQAWLPGALPFGRLPAARARFY